MDGAEFFFLLLRPVVDWAKSSGVQQFLFISSAGIYKPTDEPPHIEGVCMYDPLSTYGMKFFCLQTYSRIIITGSC